MDFVHVTSGQLELIKCTQLPVKHAFTTRVGGVSRGVLSGLNIGRGRGDTPDALAENYRRLAAAVGFDPAGMALSKQVHGRTVRTVAEGAAFDRQPIGDCDALTTNIPGIALVVYGADCVPVLLYDPRTKSVGAAHAGWRGTANGVVDALLERMKTEYGARPEDMTAAIGPAIEAGCYETGKAEASALASAVGGSAIGGSAIGGCADLIKLSPGGGFYADLKGMNALRLRRAGVRRISICGDCTHCDERLFWSHRRDGNLRGLQGAVIMLELGNNDAEI